MITYCSDTSFEYFYNKKGLYLKYLGPVLKKRTSFDAFAADIKNAFPGTKEFNISNEVIMLENPDFSIGITETPCSYDVQGYTRTIEILQTIAEIGKKAYDSENVDMNVMLHDYYMTPTGLGQDSDYLSMDSLPSPLYVPYIDTELMFEQFFKSSENILLLTGKSGVGKSKLSSLAIEYLSRHTEKINADIASTSDVNVLANDGFWNELELNDIDLVILDDLDYMLTPRSEEQNASDAAKNRFISNFLSFTDGFKKNNIKFIITTNQSVDTIDTSLLRKGRMFDILELRELTNKEARDIWNQYAAGKPFKVKGSILACDLAQEIETANSEFTKQNYLRDPKVSRLSNFSKTIGF